MLLNEFLKEHEALLESTAPLKAEEAELPALNCGPTKR